MNKVLITGATGFIGSHVVEYFSEKKVPVVCFVRESGDTSFIKQLNTEIVFGDIKNIDSIKRALTDIDLVIHTAGRSSDWGKYSDFYTNNVTGTLNILEACKELNIKNIIITGSVSSYGEEDSDILKDENSPYNSHYNYFCDRIFPSSMNFYRDTKALLTQKSIEFAEKHGLDLTVIEPVWVYGEREFNTGFFEYLKSVNEGAGSLPGSKFNKFHVIYARDLAKAYYAAYKKKLNGVHRIIIGERNAHKMNFIYNTFCKTANLRPPVLLPKFITYPVGFLLEITAVLFRMKEPLLLSRSRVNMMYDNIEFSTEKAMKFIDFQADTSLHDGILKTVKWYKNNGFLDDKKT